jgi:3'-5' exonuclease
MSGNAGEGPRGGVDISGRVGSCGGMSAACGSGPSDGHIREIAEYCESDVLNTYRVWLRHELFRGRLSHAEFQASEANLIEFVRVHSNTKPYLPV